MSSLIQSVAIFAGFFLAPFSLAQEIPVICSTPDREFIENLIEKHKDLPRKQRFLAISDAFLGDDAFWEQVKENEEKVKKEKLKTSAEEAPKEDLTIKLSVLDCVKYTEIVLAATEASDWDSFVEHLAAIRYYDSNPSAAHRRHFPEVDWIPGVVENGYAVDVTESVAFDFNPRSLRTGGPVTINRAAFFENLYPAHYNLFRASFPESEHVIENTTLPYIDFDEMWTESQATPEARAKFESKELKLFEEMKSLLQSESDPNRVKAIKKELDTIRREIRLVGAVLDPEFIRALPEVSIGTFIRINYGIPKNDGTYMTEMLVTHHGIVIRKGDKLFLRHTSTKRHRKVMKLSFEDYVGNFLVSGSNTDTVDNRRSTWRGMHFLAIQD